MAIEHMRKARWAGHGSDWSDGHRPCVKCGEMKPFSQFHKHPKCLHGVNTVCKSCRKPLSKKQYKKVSVEQRLWASAKSRAKKNGREFTIKVSDIVIPERCPVLGTEFVVNTEYAASIDRRDSNHGYTPDNIRIISRRANTLKNNSDFDEMTRVLKYMKECRRFLF